MRVHLSGKLIYNYLLAVEKSFVPKLSSTTNLKEYSIKLSRKAELFCEFDKDELIGLVAVYCNNKESAFITSVSVLETHRGKGIAYSLLNEVRDYLFKNDFKEILLEVNNNNNKPLKFYKTYGFIQYAHTTDNIVKMKLNI